MFNTNKSFDQLVETVEAWDKLPEQPVVTIYTATYNHEKFIEQCLDGILMQQTDFPFEMLIKEDCSTDRTREIVIDYQRRHPDKIRLLLCRENLYSQKIKFPDELAPLRRGKYIALCEGDDYWTDPLKLQKQVDFLEAHPEYVVTFHDFCTVDADGKPVEHIKFPSQNKRDYSSDELQRGCWLHTLTLCYRNVIRVPPPEYRAVVNGDSFLVSLLGAHGGAKYMDDIQPSVYRSHPGGVWGRRSLRQKAQAQVKTFGVMRSYYKRIGNTAVADSYYDKYAAACSRLLRHSLTERDLVTASKAMARIIGIKGHRLLKRLPLLP